MLKGFLKRSGKSRSDWASEWGISEAFLSQIANRRKRPSLDLAVRIERATGGAVPAASWIEDEDAETTAANGSPADRPEPEHESDRRVA